MCRHSQESCVSIASHPLAFWTPPPLDAKVAMSPTCAGCWMSLLQSVAHMCLPSGTFCSQNAKGGIIFQSHSSCWRLESRCGAEGSCPAWSREGVTMTLRSSVSWLAVLRNLEIMSTRNYGRASQVALVVKNLPANAREVRDAGSIPGSGRSPGGGHGNPLQHSCLENPMEREAWQATVHRVTQSQIRLKRLSMQACIIMGIYWKLHIRLHSVWDCISTLSGRKQQHSILTGRGPRLVEGKSLDQGLGANQGQIQNAKLGVWTLWDPAFSELHGRPSKPS